jgi:hypothetical protein
MVFERFRRQNDAPPIIQFPAKAQQFNDILRRGKIVKFPNIGVGMSKVHDAFLTHPKYAEDVVEGLTNAYPDKQVQKIPEPFPNEIRVEAVSAAQNPDESIVYVGVNEQGSLPHTSTVHESYYAVSGELIVSTKSKFRKVKEQTLLPNTEMVIKPGVIRSARAKDGWTIFQTKSHPAHAADSHQIASERMLKKFGR